MTIYFVTVTAPGGCRYFDSVWVRKENAETRNKQLRDEFNRSGLPLNGVGQNRLDKEWDTRVTTAEACDGSIQDSVSDSEDRSAPISDFPAGKK